jgi:hypothetical protein
MDHDVEERAYDQPKEKDPDADHADDFYRKAYGVKEPRHASIPLTSWRR